MIKEALLWKRSGKEKIRCQLCSHECDIDDGDFGICGMRENRGGALFTHAYGKLIANHVDPIEKKPFYHFLPGTSAYSIATIGCNFKCSFCQNWTISQLSARNEEGEGSRMTPDAIVKDALKKKCESISYTYTEPTVFFEYAYETAKLAQKENLRNTFVTNGYMTRDAIDMIAPYLDAANIDLKFFKDEIYQRMCGGHLDPVLDSIRYMVDKGIWVEVTTLVVPGENDSEEDLKGIASFLAGVSSDIPWHVSRFHPDYKVLDKYPTMMETLEVARAIGKAEGLKYIYLGNVAEGNDTFCAECREKLIGRENYDGQPTNKFDPDGKCISCGKEIVGVWR